MKVYRLRGPVRHAKRYAASVIVNVAVIAFLAGVRHAIADEGWTEAISAATTFVVWLTVVFAGVGAWRWLWKDASR